MPVNLFVFAYLLDWIIGDPEWLPHPVRLIGIFISNGEKVGRKFVRSKYGEFIAGSLLTIFVVGVTGGISFFLLRYATGLKDRKSTRLNSSHRCISYAVFC